MLAYRDLDDALGLTDLAASVLGDGRRGKNIRHKLPNLTRQSVFGRLAGYEDANDAERLAHDPVRHRLLKHEERRSMSRDPKGGVRPNSNKVDLEQAPMTFTAPIRRGHSSKTAHNARALVSRLFSGQNRQRSGANWGMPGQGYSDVEAGVKWVMSA